MGTEKKKKFIFLANPTVGHTSFLISLALKAKENDSEVLFMLPGVTNTFIRNILDNPSLNIDSKLKNSSIPYKIIPISLSQAILGLILPYKRGRKEVAFALNFFSAGSKKYIDFIINECLKERPDAIIYDYTFFPAIAVSERLQIPRVAIYHTGLPFLGYPIPPIGFPYKYDAYSLNEFNDAKRFYLKIENKLKLKYENIIKQPILTDFTISPSSSFLNVINTIKEAEYPRNNLTNNILFVGPSLQTTLENNENLFFDKKNNKLIYISLGTVFNKNTELFVKIINSIKYEKCEILVSAGDSYNKLKDMSFKENVHIEKFVPQVNVLYQTDVFITHGGKNSINEALIIGVPMILFPIGGEQQYNAKLAEYINTGINFENIKNSFTNQQMTEAIERLLNDKIISSSVKSLSKVLQNSDGAEIAYDEISQKLQFFYAENSKNI